jgi:hypothetical protein
MAGHRLTRGWCKRRGRAVSELHQTLCWIGSSAQRPTREDPNDHRGRHEPFLMGCDVQTEPLSYRLPLGLLKWRRRNVFVAFNEHEQAGSRPLSSTAHGMLGRWGCRRTGTIPAEKFAQVARIWAELFRCNLSIPWNRWPLAGCRS